MSSLEKLVRALETLRTSDTAAAAAAAGATSPGSPQESSLRASLADLKPAALLFRQRESALSSREKKQCCGNLADGIVSAALRPSPDLLQRHLPAVVETLLQLADDGDADVRTAADESLNRIVRGLSENNMGRLLVELYKGIKQSHSPRSVSAALTRFAELANRIRPQKRRAYVVNLFPCVLRLSQRSEMALQESLSAALVKMAPVLGVFFTDGEVKAVLQAFLPNLEHSQASLRRAASHAMVALVSQCRKPEAFLPWLLATLLDSLVPLKPPDEEPAGRVLGVLLCLRDIIPLLEELCDGVSLERLLQLYELLLHYSQHANHNVVTSALDALCQLLRAPPAELLAALLTEGSLERSRLQPDAQPAVSKAPSVLSVAPSVAGDEADLGDTDSLLWPGEDAARDESGTESPPPPSAAPAPAAETDEPALRVGTPPADDVIDPLRYDISPPTDDSADTAAGDGTQGVPAGDVGSLTDGGVPLIYCCRLIVSRYLLTGVPKGIRPDREVRVSIKVLCVNCISAAVSLAPDILSLPLLIDKDPDSADCQYLWDVLLFVGDGDPQLRGAVALLTGTYLRAAALQPVGAEAERPAALQTRPLLDQLQQVLLDASHVSSRQALEGLGQCLEPLLKGPSCELLLSLLAALLRLADHSYWLVKVDLCALVAALPLPELELLWRWGAADDSSYHQLLLDDLLLRLLEDADQRVQQAAATALVSYVQRVPVSVDAEGWTAEAAVRQRCSLLPPPQPWGVGLTVSGPGRGAGPPFTDAERRRAGRPELGAALSAVVSRLVSTLMMTDSKHMVSGVLLALRALMDKMPATVYTEAWQVNHKRYRRGLYQLCVSMVTSTHLMHDLTAHTNLVHLAASLAAGICVRQQRTRPSQSREERLRANWDLLEPLVAHLLRVLNIYTHLAGDTQPTTPQSKPSLPSFPSASSLSPIKKRSTPERSKSATSTASAAGPAPAATDRAGSQERDDKEVDKKAKQAVGFFMSSPEYQKLYSMLKTIHETFKITLNAQSSAKLLGVLDGSLTALGILLELVGTAQVAPLAEELLGYITGLIRLSPALALHCVLQLLRAMFGSAEAVRQPPPGQLSRDVSNASCTGDEEPGLYQACVNGPYAEFAAFVASSRRLTVAEETSAPPRPEYDSRRPGLTAGRGTDKQALASYIRVFEPSVIKALKLYTVTSDPQVQSQVLWLLIQLVQLRVNYCLLDSDQIFIGYVIKQLEYVEEGQMKEGNQVIPAIFRFLVVLSYERYHSKTIVSIPKVIQLCDGLIASGQPPDVYALPALRPVVEDLFVSARPSVQDVNELEAQKEVLLSMLLRLIQYPEVLELVSLAVCESRREGEERWRLTSRAVLDALLPPLLQLHVRLDSAEALVSLHRLLAALCPRAVRPAEDLLAGVLRQPVGVSSVSDIQRWGGMLSALLRVLVAHVREDVLLARVDDLGLATTEMHGDRERTVSAQEIIVRFLLSALELLVTQLASVVASPLMSGTTTFLPQLLAQLLQIIIYILQSGSFGECARCAMWLVSDGLYDLEPISQAFVSLSTVRPVLLLSWCNLLTLLNYRQLQFWRALTQPPRDPSWESTGCLALDLARKGALILLCDYMCENTSDGELLAWLLTSHMTELVSLSPEPPVSDMLAALHRNPSASGLLIQAIAARCRHIDQPLMAQRVLRCLEGAPASQYGPLLVLLSRRLMTSHHLVVADEVIRLACRKLEIMLAAEDRILSEDNFNELVENISKEPSLRRETELLSLVTRLGQTFFGVTLQLSVEDALRPVTAPPTVPDRQWYLELVRDTSGWSEAPGRECARLLSRLERQEILDVLLADGTDLAILEHCFRPPDIGAEPAGSALYAAAETALCQHLEHLCSQLPSPDQAFASDRYRKYTRRLEERLCEPALWRRLLRLSGATEAYCASRHSAAGHLEPADTAAAPLARLALLCLEALRHSVACRLPELPRHVRLLLGTAAGCLRFSSVLAALSSRDNQWTILAVNAIYRVTRVLRGALPETSVSAVSSGVESRVYQRMASLMLWAESLQDRHETAARIRSVILAVGRLPLLSSFLRVPPDVYRLGWDEQERQRQGRFSPVAVQYLQEADVLKQYILRVNTLGWTGRREFEETWMTYLSVLNAATEDETSNREELAVLLQTNCLAVRGITSLLLQTLTSMTPGYPEVSATLHHPRDQQPVFVPGSSIMHLHHTLLQLEAAVAASPLLPSMWFARQLNLERRHDAAEYGHAQLSLRYLQGVISGNDGVHSGREVALSAAGLDINSCLVFLLQLYAQWTAPELGVPLPLLIETVRSAVLLSDLLTERAQFEWLLACCVTLYQVHPIDDEIMLQYLVLGLCKAAAVLDAEEATVVETVRRAVEHGLRCSLPPVRIATVHGCLYLLQLGPGELSNSVLPALVEFVQRSLQHIATVPGYNDDYDLAVWAAVVYVLHHYDDGLAESEFSPAVLQLAFSLAGSTRSSALYEALMKGIERLVVCGVVSGSAGPMELAVEQLRHRSGPAQLHALSLLTACLFSGPGGTATHASPETFIHVLEKYSNVFTKMKATPGFLSTVLCSTVTSGLLRLCPPSEVMNRVIGEFISPHQSHVLALADTVFQVFEACVSQHQEALLQDWVLFSLPNFATARPADRSTWLLACFLAGASRRPWLRAAFPLLQRCGDEVDLPGGRCPHLAQLFLVAATDFYAQLSGSQRRQFIAAIETPASGGDHTYKQLLLSLTDGSTVPATSG